MNKTKRIWPSAVITIILGIGITSMVSCGKDEAGAIVPDSQQPVIQNTSCSSELIPILTICPGKKMGEPFHKYCVGTKGVCFLWFGGLFLQDPGNYCPTNPTVYSTLTKGDGNTLEMNVYYGMAEDEIQASFASQAKSGRVFLSEDNAISDTSLLSYLGLESPVVLDSGSYIVQYLDTLASVFTMNVTYSQSN